MSKKLLLQSLSLIALTMVFGFILAVLFIR
jgi:hypothetical protein